MITTSVGPSVGNPFSAMAAGFGFHPQKAVDPTFTATFPEHAEKIFAKPNIVLAEDNPGDVFLVREALATHGLDVSLTVMPDGEQMLHFVERLEKNEELCPDLILLDLNLPKRNGESLLKRIRGSSVCGRTPVVIVTSSDSPRDRENTARLGASSYFRKPPDLQEFLLLGALAKRLLNPQIA